MNYRLAYALGFHPWEDLADHEPYANTLLELVAREENGAGPPYGSALDIGTGSGVWGVQLAERGWRVTGVDIVDKALGRARERIEEAGVEMRVMHGDVTALPDSDVGSGFRLVLDTGTFHGLDEAQRAAMARGLSSPLCRPDATVLVDCFAPKRRGPLPAWSEPSGGGARVLAGMGDHGRGRRGLGAGPDSTAVQVRLRFLPAAPHERRLGDRRDRQRGYALAAADEAHPLAGRELHVHRAWLEARRLGQARAHLVAEGGELWLLAGERCVDVGGPVAGVGELLRRLRAAARASRRRASARPCPGSARRCRRGPRRRAARR